MVDYSRGTANSHATAAAGKPEAQAEGIRAVDPEASRIPLGSRLGLQGHRFGNPDGRITIRRQAAGR
jgi:hypothetical protein